MIIGITGTIGAGKGTIVSYLEKKGFWHISVSGFLEGEALKRNKAPTRLVRREIGNEYRAKSPHALLEAVLGDINPKKENVVVESLHTVAEVEYVQGLGGKVISIDAPLALRWERIKERGADKDAGSYEDFLAEQDKQMASKNPNENNLESAIGKADFHLQNSGSEEELFRAVDAILAGLA